MAWFAGAAPVGWTTGPLLVGSGILVELVRYSEGMGSMMTDGRLVLGPGGQALPVPSGMVMMPVVPASSVGVGMMGTVTMPVVPASCVGVSCRPLGMTLGSHLSAGRV